MKFSNSNYLYILFAICFISGMVGATVSTLMPAFLPEVLKELRGNVTGIELDHAAALINSMFLFGWMFGGFLWGLFCDHYGLKKSLVYSCLIYGLSSVLIAFSASWDLVLIFLFMAGFGVGGVIVITTIFISEVWTPANRSVAIGLLTVCFPIGIFLSGAITSFVHDWRPAFFIGTVPLILSFVAFWLLREPEHALNQIERKPPHQNIPSLFNNSNRKYVVIGSISFGTILIGLLAVFAWLPSWIQSLLGVVDGQKARGYAMMSLAFAALFGSACSGWISNVFGLRLSMLLCFIVCFLCSVLLFKLTTVFTNIVYFKIGVLGFFFGVSQGVLSDFISKIFPKQIRATATGFCFNAGRLFTASAVFFVGWLVQFLGGYGNSIFMFSWVFVLGFIAAFLMEEKAMLTN